jgi:hypothetical protein
MPRVVVIDEFHELFEEPDRIGNAAFAAFSNMLLMGPFAGVRIVLASQTPVWDARDGSPPPSPHRSWRYSTRRPGAASKTEGSGTIVSVNGTVLHGWTGRAGHSTGSA